MEYRQITGKIEEFFKAIFQIVASPYERDPHPMKQGTKNSSNPTKSVYFCLFFW